VIIEDEYEAYEVLAGMGSLTPYADSMGRGIHIRLRRKEDNYVILSSPWTNYANFLFSVEIKLREQVAIIEWYNGYDQ